MKSKRWAIGWLALAGLAIGIGVWGIAIRPERLSGTQVTMYRSPGCSCCEGWKRHMEENGFRVETVATDRLYQVKIARGVPEELASCHTAIVEGRVVEGHVPAETVRWMLEDPAGPPGIAVGGMPAGSPGMSGMPEPFDVVAFENGGAGSAYAVYGLGGTKATASPAVTSGR